VTAELVPMIEHQLDELTNVRVILRGGGGGGTNGGVVESAYQVMEKHNVDRVIISISVSPAVCCLRAL